MFPQSTLPFQQKNLTTQVCLFATRSVVVFVATGQYASEDIQQMNPWSYACKFCMVFGFVYLNVFSIGLFPLSMDQWK